MLFEKRFWAGIANGTITATFRRWKRPMASAGRPNRTPAGIVMVESVDIVTEADITDADARAAGYADAVSLIADLRGDPGEPIYRVRFRLADGPDPREKLAGDAALTPADAEALRTRLARMDRAAAAGPWTEQTLRLIKENPAVRAADLCLQVGREMQPFKTDVRKLKNLGLTISLGTGYRLSPRGEAYLATLDASGGRASEGR